MCVDADSQLCGCVYELLTSHACVCVCVYTLSVSESEYQVEFPRGMLGGWGLSSDFWTSGNKGYCYMKMMWFSGCWWGNTGHEVWSTAVDRLHYGWQLSFIGTDSRSEEHTSELQSR